MKPIHLVVISLAMGTSAAIAAPTASGGAYDFDVHVSVAAVSVLDVTRPEEVGFTDLSTAYSESKGIIDFNVATALASLSADSTSVETQWIPGESFLAVGSRATVTNVALGVVNVLSSSLLGVQANQIQSTSIITGTCPAAAIPAPSVVSLVDGYIFRNGFEAQNLFPSGDSNLPGLAISIQGSAVTGLNTLPPANTVVDIGALGTLVLNEQTITGDGIAGLSLASNALDLQLDIAGIITASVIIAHSEVSVSCN